MTGSENSTHPYPAQNDRNTLFKQRLSVAFRALAGPKARKKDPEGAATPSGTDARGHADSQALRLSLQDQALYTRTCPTPPESALLFKALEQARYEALGSLCLKGVSQNLDSLLTERYKTLLTRDDREGDTEKLAGIISLILRASLLKASLPSWAKKLITPQYAQFLEHNNFVHLAEMAHDQAGFAQEAHNIIKALGFPLEPPPTDNKQNIAEGKTPPAPPPPQSKKPEDGREQHERPALAPGGLGQGKKTESLHDNIPAGQHVNKTRAGGHIPTYRVFTKAYDQIVTADNLRSHADLVRLRQKLDEQMPPPHLYGLAHGLRRRLMAHRRMRWSFNPETGRLDPARLASFIIKPFATSPFRETVDTPVQDTVISLLLDNSGSMRGHPVMMVALSAEILAQILESCGIKTEILGFTTRAWRGGRAQHTWRHEGKPPHPGRLNELRHIIYKSMSEPWSRARHKLGLLLDEGILKENIDGEAIIWACKRLQSYPFERKVLMVISDGAPVDEATREANGPGYLEQHLKTVIRRVERQGNFDITALGIGHDVTPYYKNSITLRHVDDIGSVMLEKLETLFQNPSGRSS